MPSYSVPHSITATIHMGLHTSLLPLFFFFLLLLHPLPSHAQLTYPPPSDFYHPGFSTTVAVIVIIMVTAFFSMAFFSIYLRRCSEDPSPESRIHAAGGHSRRGTHRGLDKAVVENFPTMVYSEVKELRLGRTSLECAVCLCEFEDAETLRLLPKCSHAFHTDCIDMWLDSHSTCPVCRSDLAAASAEVEQQQQAPAHVAIEVDEEEESGGRVWAEEERERFTLRLPEDVRKEMMGRRLDRSVTMSLSKGSRGGWSFKKEWAAKSDRWAFLGRTWSLRTPRGKGEGTSNTKDDGEPSTSTSTATASRDKLGSRRSPTFSLV